MVVFHESTELRVVLVGLGIRGQSTRGAILDNSAWSPSGIVAFGYWIAGLLGVRLSELGEGPSPSRRDCGVGQRRTRS